MPAAAVIPALIACIKIAAVKTLVVALRRLVGRSTHRVRTGPDWRFIPGCLWCRSFGAFGGPGGLP